MQTWRRSVVLAGLVLALLACGFVWAGGLAFGIRIPEATMNAAIASRLPLSRALGPVSWRVDDTALHLPDGGRIGLDAHLSATAGGRRATAHLSGSAGLRYQDGAFWLSGVRANVLDDAVEDERYPPGGAWHGLLSDMRDALARASSRHLDQVLDEVFRVVPVYRLPETLKGQAARLVLDRVTTDGRDLVVWMDPAGALLRALAAMLAVAIAIYAGVGVAVLWGGVWEGLADLFFWW